MSDLEKCGLPRAGRQADDNALVGIQTNVSFILSQDADGNDVVLTAHNHDDSAGWVIEGLLHRGGVLEVDIYDL